MSENFRKKVVELATKLNSSVANYCDIFLVAPFSSPTIRLNPVGDVNLPQIKIARQDVFLVEKIAYAIQDNTDQKLISHGIVGFSLNDVYAGKISYIQAKTLIASNISLYDFYYRNVFGNATNEINEFCWKNIEKELTPYWLISGEKDNEIVLEYANTPNIAGFSLVVKLSGILYPNTARNL
jgi:hypothetical protein